MIRFLNFDTASEAYVLHRTHSRFVPLLLNSNAQRLNILKQQFWRKTVSCTAISEEFQPTATAQPLLFEIVVDTSTGTLGILRYLMR